MCQITSLTQAFVHSQLFWWSSYCLCVCLWMEEFTKKTCLTMRHCGNKRKFKLQQQLSNVTVTQASHSRFEDGVYWLVYYSSTPWNFVMYHHKLKLFLKTAPKVVCNWGLGLCLCSWLKWSFQAFSYIKIKCKLHSPPVTKWNYRLCWFWWLLWKKFRNWRLPFPRASLPIFSKINRFFNLQITGGNIFYEHHFYLIKATFCRR